VLKLQERLKAHQKKHWRDIPKSYLPTLKAIKEYISKLPTLSIDASEGIDTEKVLLSLVDNMQANKSTIVILYEKELGDRLVGIKTVQDLVNYAVDVQAMMAKPS